MKDENCIFCKLANGEIPTMSLYEDGDFNVIFDAGPATFGHALIITKNHYKNIYEIDEETIAKAYKLAKKMAAVMTEVFHADGFNILQNNNSCAGQTVFHFHIHLIPRYEGEKSLIGWVPGKQDTEKLAAALPEIKAVLAAE